MKQLVLTSIWIAALILAWRSGAWTSNNPDTEESTEMSAHDRMFHMHQPLHEGGKVGMSGQYHLELISHSEGDHRLWISNAFRQEMDPAGFSGTLTLKTSDGLSAPVPFERIGRTKELIAKYEPLDGQAWLIVNGTMGNGAAFDNMRFFWDHGATSKLTVPPLGLDSMVPVPEDNVPTEEKVAFGRDLFFDKQLSADGSTSCATCHRPDYAFAQSDTVPRGIGGQLGKRNTPSVMNTAYYPEFLWDGSSVSLEAQALEPLQNPAEMGNDNEAAFVARLTEKYAERSQQAMNENLSFAAIAKALACYQRTLFSGDSDFDRFESGDREAISQSAKRGRSLFFGKANCGNCHVPPLFTDFEFHNLGVGWQGKDRGDLGRFHVSGDDADLGAFRTPSLRDVELTAPYMHDGSIPTLRAVVEFYRRGGQANEFQGKLIAPLKLVSQEIDDLVAFLKALNGRTDRRSDQAEQSSGNAAIGRSSFETAGAARTGWGFSQPSDESTSVSMTVDESEVRLFRSTGHSRNEEATP